MNRPAGMQAFVVIWSGQVISLLGSAMTWFAFTLWVWQKTEQASALATVSFLVFLPSLLFMPLAGVMVDRWERKQTLMLSDMGSAFATLVACFCINPMRWRCGTFTSSACWLVSLPRFNIPPTLQPPPSLSRNRITPAHKG
jgi:MFS family permease